MVRCEENIINTDVFLNSQILDFFEILGSSGRPGTSFWQLFGCLGRILVVREGAGNTVQYCYPGWLAGGGPRKTIIGRLEGRMMIRGGRQLTTTGCQTLKFETTSYQLPTAGHHRHRHKLTGPHRPPITSYQATELKEYQIANLHVATLRFTSLVAPGGRRIFEVFEKTRFLSRLPHSYLLYVGVAG